MMLKKLILLKMQIFFSIQKPENIKTSKTIVFFLCVQNAEIFFDSFDEYRLPLSCIKKNTCVCTDHKVDI